jgi:hypothetical protein
MDQGGCCANSPRLTLNPVLVSGAATKWQLHSPVEFFAIQIRLFLGWVRIKFASRADLAGNG